MASDESQTRRDQSDQPSKDDDLPLETDAGAVPFEDWNTFLIRFPDGQEITVVMAGEDLFA